MAKGKKAQFFNAITVSSTPFEATNMPISNLDEIMLDV